MNLTKKISFNIKSKLAQNWNLVFFVLENKLLNFYLLLCSWFALIHGSNIPGSYATLLFTASDIASITSTIHNWVLFLLWLHPSILSEVISPLISSSILSTYRPGAFLFQYPIILPSHAVLKARILKCFAIPFSSGPHSVRPLHHDPTVLGGPTRHGLVSLS